MDGVEGGRLAGKDVARAATEPREAQHLTPFGRPNQHTDYVASPSRGRPEALPCHYRPRFPPSIMRRRPVEARWSACSCPAETRAQPFSCGYRRHGPSKQRDLECLRCGEPEIKYMFREKERAVSDEGRRDKDEIETQSKDGDRSDPRRDV